MCKLPGWRSLSFLFCFLLICRLQYGSPASPSDSWSSAKVQTAQKNVERVQALVTQGALPQSDLASAQEKLADAQDKDTLAKTLYSGHSAQDMTMEESKAMMAAARRRVDRQVKRVENGRALQRKGLLSRSKLAAIKAELATRRRILQLADERAKEVQEIAAMADVEGATADKTGVEPLLTPEIRYDGYGHFHLRELRSIRRAYYKEFDQRLPVTAVGETALHRRLGLNHRGRVDVGLNPDCPQGVWLRHYLEKRHIPYLAFRCAIKGAATAPHIHIGPESTRLHLARHVRRHKKPPLHRQEARR
ncbi:MAG TPA: hypothetical protein VF283_23735 [Bryobacteraceae bacterium]